MRAHRAPRRSTARAVALRRAVALSAAVAVAAGAAGARAESGRLNVHANLGLHILSPGAFGVLGGGGLDWQLRPPIAIDVALSGGAFSPNDAPPENLFAVAAGLRLRLIDNREGYAEERGGDQWGNFYLVPRIGYLTNTHTDAAYVTLDLELGYEFSMARPFQIGPFVRSGAALGDHSFGYLVTGVSFSLEFIRAPVWDSDGDGLSNERELTRYHTRPCRADTDGGGVPDGVEVQRGSDPLERADDRPLADRIARENDPALVDTDEDGVPDATDACPGTRLRTPVDARGCVPLAPEVVLEGITFAFNSAEIQPESEDALVRAVQLLRDNPDARVEIDGHTDDVGSDAYNLTLSEKRADAVAFWLIAHGIDDARLTVRGFGNTRPKAPNDSEAHRALNRRIEFRRLDLP